MPTQPKLYTCKKQLQLLLFLLTCLSGIIAMYYHEMWRDEAQAFLLVRDSKSFVGLWQNVRYEGHPFLWYLLLFFAWHLAPSIYTMQLVHLVIGLGVAALIIFRSPFTFVQKVLLCFSYLFSFEYLVISRNYAIGVFLLFLAIFIYKQSRSQKVIIYLSLIAGLCINSNVYLFIIGGCLFVCMVYKHTKLYGAFNKSLIVASLIFLLFAIVALMQILPPPGRTPVLKMSYKVTLQKAIRVSAEISKGMFCMPNPMKKQNYWGSSLFAGDLPVNKLVNLLLFNLPQWLMLATLISLLFACRGSPEVLLFFVAAFVGLLMFVCFVFNRGLVRHNGSFFVLLVAVAWLCDPVPAMKKPAVYFRYLFNTMLAVQFAGSIVAHVGDFIYPFSGAKDAASFLVAHHRNNESIILHPDYEGMALLQYAGIPAVFYGTTRAKGSFIRFNAMRKPCSYNDLFALALKEHIATMIFNGKMNDTLMSRNGYELIYHSGASYTVADEDFFIYGKKQKE